MLDKAGQLLLKALQAGIGAAQLSAETSKDALRQVLHLALEQLSGLHGLPAPGLSAAIAHLRQLLGDTALSNDQG